MKLYRVHIDRVLYIVAEDALDAERLAVHVDPNMDETEVDVAPANENIVRMDGWENHPPYGQSGEIKTAGELVSKAKVS